MEAKEPDNTMVDTFPEAEDERHCDILCHVETVALVAILADTLA